VHARLVGVPGSHPCVSAELMLRYKGIEFTRLDLPNMTHKALLPLLRHRGSTVPVMTLDGTRVSGTMKIARALDHFVPAPPLFPAEDRATVEGAEAWADSVLQDGANDNRGMRGRGPDAKYDPNWDWHAQNIKMLAALTEKGYDVNFCWGIGAHNGKHGGAILPDSLRWLWRGWKN